MAVKITVYTINNCQYSKAEKEYLAANNLAFEEKNLEANRELLTEMLAVSNNFAGTPVTKIEKEDGKIVVLKGFTKEEFDQALGIGAPKVAVAEASMTPPQPTPPQPTPAPPSSVPTTPSEPPPKPMIEIPPLDVSQAPTIPPAVTPPSETPVTPPTTPSTPPQANDQLNSILNDLQQKAGA